MATNTKLDPAPLVDLIRLRWPQEDKRTIERILGLGKSTLTRWMSGERLVSVKFADKVCEHLHVLPVEVWGMDYYEAAKINLEEPENDTVRICDVDGCWRKHNAHGYCIGHYWQHQQGKPITPITRHASECSTDGCDNPHRANGLCQKCRNKARPSRAKVSV